MRLAIFFITLAVNFAFWWWMFEKFFSPKDIGALAIGGGVAIFAGIFCQVLFFGIYSVQASSIWHKRIAYGSLLIPLFYAAAIGAWGKW